MNISYLQDLSSESKRLGDKLQELTREEIYYTNIVTAAPLAEMRLLEIKRMKQDAQKQLDEVTRQAKEERTKILHVQTAAAVLISKSGGMKQ